MNFIEYLDKYNVNPIFMLCAIFIVIFIIVNLLSELLKESLIPFFKKVTTIEKDGLKITTNRQIKTSDIEKVINEVNSMVSEKTKIISDCEKRLDKMKENIEDWSPMFHNLPKIYFTFIKNLISLDLEKCSFGDCKKVICELQKSEEIKSIEYFLAEKNKKKDKYFRNCK